MKTLIRFEVRKIFSKKLTQAAVAAVLLLSVLFTVSTYQNMYAFDGVSREGSGGAAVAIDRSVAEKYAGPLTDEKVRQMMADFAPHTDLHGMNAVYLYQNATQSAAFARFAAQDGSWNGLTVTDVFGEEEIRTGYINGWLKVSDDLVKPLLLLCVVVMVMAAPVFAGEYSSGVDNIILSSRYGRTKCAAAKVAAAGLAALLVTAVTCAAGILPAFLLYGSDGLGCSILFAPLEYTEAYIPFPITVGTLLAYQALLAFTAVASVTGVTLLLSALARNQTVALVASAAVIFFPMLLPVSERSPLFRYIALLLPPYHVQFVSLMSVERFGGNLLYAILTVPVAVVLMSLGGLLSRKVFAKHQIS